MTAEHTADPAPTADQAHAHSDEGLATAGALLDAEAHASAEAHAPAEAHAAVEGLAPVEEGSVVRFGSERPVVTDGLGSETESGQARGGRTVHDNVSRTVKTVLTANPNRTKAPIRQEVNR
jgi:hypothetical protein